MSRDEWVAQLCAAGVVVLTVGTMIFAYLGEGLIGETAAEGLRRVSVDGTLGLLAASQALGVVVLSGLSGRRGAGSFGWGSLPGVAVVLVLLGAAVEDERNHDLLQTLVSLNQTLTWALVGSVFVCGIWAAVPRERQESPAALERPRKTKHWRVSRSGVRCAFCRDDVSYGEWVHTCSACGTVIQGSCLLESGGCVTYGCEHTPPRRTVRT